MSDLIMQLKDKILDELLNDMDEHESEKLRPPSTMVAADEACDDGKDGGLPPMGDGDDEDDDELRQAMERYSRD